MVDISQYTDDISNAYKSANSELYNNDKTKDNCAIPKLPDNIQKNLDKAMDFLDEVQSSELLSCDATCQRNKELNRLKEKMLRAQNVFRDAHDQLENAERNYYTFLNGSVWYDKWKRNKLNKEIDNDISSYEARIARVNKRLDKSNENRNKDIEENNKLNKYLGDLEALYQDKIKHEVEDNEKKIKENKILNRLTYYENEDKEYFESWNEIILWCFIVLITVYAVSFIFLNGEYKNPILLKYRVKVISIWCIFISIWYFMYSRKF